MTMISKCPECGSTDTRFLFVSKDISVGWTGSGSLYQCEACKRVYVERRP